MPPLGMIMEGHLLRKQRSGKQCAYCGRITNHWIKAAGGPLCALPMTESCKYICSQHGWKVLNDLRIKRHANGWFASLFKSYTICDLEGPIGKIIASFLGKV